MGSNNNIRFLNDDTRRVVEGLDSVKSSLLKGDITDVMVVGINKEGNILSLSSLGDNVLSLLGALRFCTDHVSDIIAMGVETHSLDESDFDDDD